jgi:AraC family ethanolamine operon transcriptional activator
MELLKSSENDSPRNENRSRVQRAEWSLTDIEQLAPMVPEWRGQFEQVTCGRIVGTFRVASGTTLRTASMTVHQRVRARGGDASGRVAVYPVTDANAGSLWHGQSLAPGQLVVHGVGSDTDHVSDRTSTVLGLSILPDRLEDAARVLLDRDEPVAPRSWSVSETAPGSADRLARAITRMLAPPRADDGDDRAEGDGLRELVRLLFGACSTPATLPLPTRSRLVDRAETYMRSRLADPFDAIELCRELGVSDRTLRQAFRERFGVGPMCYFRVLRLNAVRSRLRSNRDMPVAVAARALGFRHLGHFAADYARLFGELPGKSRR